MPAPVSDYTWATDATWSAVGEAWDGLPTKADPSPLRPSGYRPEPLIAQYLNGHFAILAEWLAYLADRVDNVNNAENFRVKSGGAIRVESFGQIEVLNGGLVFIRNGAEFAIEFGVTATCAGILGIVSGGGLDIRNGAALEVDFGGTATVKAGGTLDVDGTATVGAGGALNVNGTATVAGGLTVTSAGAATINGVISTGASGRLLERFAAGADAAGTYYAGSALSPRIVRVRGLTADRAYNLGAAGNGHCGRITFVAAGADTGFHADFSGGAGVSVPDGMNIGDFRVRNETGFCYSVTFLYDDGTAGSAGWMVESWNMVP